MSNWEKFKDSTQTPKIPRREVGGMYQCQSCNEFVMKATYFPTELVLKYTCTQDHDSYLENFKVYF